MINNFDRLVESGIVTFDDPDLGYFIQLIKRKKENPDLNKSMKVVRSYLVSTEEEYFGKVKDSIIENCDHHNVRAYLRVNRRSLYKSHIRMIKYLSDLLMYEQHEKVFSAYDTVLGRFHDESSKKWVIDYDEEGEDTVDLFDMCEYIGILLQESGNDHHGIINTPNGKHIVTGAFNSKKFGDKYPTIDIHKDNMTILYSNLT